MSTSPRRPPGLSLSPLVLLVAVVALLVATGGVSAYAGAKIATKDIERGAVTSNKIKNETIRVSDLSTTARGSLTGPAGSPGTPGSPGAPGSPGISGYERVQVYANLSAGDTFKNVSASCPPGKRLLGGGGYTQDSEMYLQYAFPQENDVYAIQAILRPGGTINEGYQVSAVAICADVRE